MQRELGGGDGADGRVVQPLDESHPMAKGRDDRLERGDSIRS